MSHRPRPTASSVGRGNLQSALRVWDREHADMGREPPETEPDGTMGVAPQVNPNDYWRKIVGEDLDGNPVIGLASPNEAGAWFDFQLYNDDLKAGDRDGSGATGPTAAELAIERQRIHATNLGTYVDATIRKISADIDARRLTTEQAIGEFNRKLDAFEAGGRLFEGIQPYTIPRGAEYVPGGEPGGLYERIGLEPFPADPIDYDPFGMALDIVASTPVLTDIGVPGTDPIQEAMDLAKSFLGG